jgi:hypothetical protein
VSRVSGWLKVAVKFVLFSLQSSMVPAMADMNQEMSPPPSSEVTNNESYLYSLIHSFDTYLFSVYHVPETTLEIGTKAINKIDILFSLM